MSEDSSIEPPAAPQLSEGYYVENFEVVLRTVDRRYRDLFLPGEISFLDDWSRLTLAARRLYVRLVSRKGPLFRRDRIVYEEIPDLGAALAELADGGFLDDARGAAADDLLALMLRRELVAAARQRLPDGAHMFGAARKEEILRTLVENLDEATLEQSVRERIDVVRTLRHETVLVFRLLFFGNLTQDWTEFVLRDLGVVRFEPYELRRELRLFPTRAALDDNLALQLARREVGTRIWAGELEEALDFGWGILERPEDGWQGRRRGRDAWHPSARRHFDRICNRLGRALERFANRDETADAETARRQALTFYEAAEAPPSRERRARLLDRLGRPKEALALCRDIEADPRDETEVHFAPRFAEKLRRRRGEPVTRRRRRPACTMTVEKKDGLTVEDLALEALAATGRGGFFSENWLWRSVFGLAFWDVVFAPVEGAFQHPFQYGPLDLQTPEFRQARVELVEERLAELRADADPGPRLLSVYDEKVLTANRFVAWGEEVRSCLALALERLRGPHLAAVCDRLSRDVGRYRRGFPDLFVLSDEEPGFELLEVKAPGDQLRPEQRAWIDYLNAQGLPAKVLRLTWRS